MPVCLHCGEINPDGALFCGKCGFTLPQPGGAPTPAALRPAGAPPLPPTYARPPAATPVPPPAAAYVPRGPYATTAPADAVPPRAAPPNAKYCVRCASLIAQAAVYCPVCQQPQP